MWPHGGIREGTCHAGAALCWQRPLPHACACDGKSAAHTVLGVREYLSFGRLAALAARCAGRGRSRRRGRARRRRRVRLAFPAGLRARIEPGRRRAGPVTWVWRRARRDAAGRCVGRGRAARGRGGAPGGAAGGPAGLVRLGGRRQAQAGRAHRDARRAADQACVRTARGEAAGARCARTAEARACPGARQRRRGTQYGCGRQRGAKAMRLQYRTRKSLSGLQCSAEGAACGAAPGGQKAPYASARTPKSCWCRATTLPLLRQRHAPTPSTFVQPCRAGQAPHPAGAGRPWRRRRQMRARTPGAARG